MNTLSKLILASFITLFFQSCQSQTNPKTAALNGKWAIEFNSNDIGLVRSFITFEFSDSTFIAYTRKGADRNILGFWKSLLGRTFTKDFKHGSLINIVDGKTKQHGDTVFLSAIFRSALNNYYFKGTILNGILKVNLLNSKKDIKGTITGSKHLSDLPLCNYPELITKVLQITRDKIYNTSVFTTSQWKQFETAINDVSAKMQDDIEMEFAFYYFAGKLPFSHYSLLRPAPKQADISTTESKEKQVLLEEKSPETLLMKIKTFSGSAAEMDSAFSVINARHYKNLIVDLRENLGGNVEPGMSFGRHLADTTFYGGVFLTQKWFVKTSVPPTTNDYKTLPAFTEKNYDLLIDGIHKEAALCLKVVPEIPVYRGRLFILTSGVTASTCEPIVYWLKTHNRATLVGEKTAGAMLNGEFFKIGDGFSVFLPTADYYAADGYRIDQKGVEPNIAVEQARALDYVMEHLIKK